MRKNSKSAVQISSIQKLSADKQNDINQILLRLAKIEFDWYQSKKELSIDCRNQNPLDIGIDQNVEL